MDRPTKNAPRMGTACVRRFLIPAALIAAVSLPTASGQTTLRIVPTESRTIESTLVRPAPVITVPLDAEGAAGATEIRIVSPTSESSAPTRSLPSPTNDIWAPLSQQSTARRVGPTCDVAVKSPAPHDDPAATAQALPDLFGQLFASAMRPATRPEAQKTSPVQQDVLTAPMAEPLQRVVPIVDDPVAFAPVPGSPAVESAPPRPADRPDLFMPLFTVASDYVPAPAPPTTTETAPQTSRIVVPEPAPAIPEGTTVRIVIAQPGPADLTASMPTANTEAVAPKIEELNSQPAPTATLASDLFGGLFEAGSVSSPTPQLVAVPAQESIAEVVPTLPPTSRYGIPEPIAQAPAAPPKPVQQPIGIVGEAPAITVPQYALSPPIAKAPVVPPKPLQQPVGVVTEAPAITVPQYAFSPPIAKAPVVPPKPVHQPVGIVTEAPAVTVPQYAASEPIVQAPAAPAKPLQQPVGLAKEPPAIPAPQSAASNPIAQAPVAQPTPIERMFDMPVEATVVPESKQVASAPAAAAPTAQPMVVERPDVVSLPQQVESIPEPHAVDPAPAHVATNSNPPVASEVAVATPTPDEPLKDYRFAGVSNDTYRSASRYAGLQNANPAANPNNTFMLLPTDTFAYADTKQPAASSATTSLSATHDATAMPQAMANSSEPLAEPQHLAAGCIGMNGMPTGCPYLPGQSGAPLVCGVDCGRYGAPCCATWRDSHCIPWSLFGPGEYVGPARPEHVSTYYLRVNDQITLTFITSRKKEAERYRIGCGDRLKLEWLRGPSNTDTSLDREVLVQPDGTIALPLVGEVTAAGKTVKDLQEELVKVYGQYQRDPHITVTPLEVNLAVQDIINAVTGVSGSNGQTQLLKVTPEGTIQAPGLGSVYVQGLTLDELRSELEARYASTFGPGLLVSPSLTERATMYVFVGGEVSTPSRYELQGPTTVMQAITLAGGWNVGGNLHQVVVFRRDENWCLRATKIDVRAPLYGNDPCPANDIWLRDNDLVIVPKSKILCATDVIQLYFTRGIYAAFPINYVYDFSASSGIVPIP